MKRPKRLRHRRTPAQLDKRAERIHHRRVNKMIMAGVLNTEPKTILWNKDQVQAYKDTVTSENFRKEEYRVTYVGPDFSKAIAGRRLPEEWDEDESDS